MDKIYELMDSMFQMLMADSWTSSDYVEMDIIRNKIKARESRLILGNAKKFFILNSTDIDVFKSGKYFLVDEDGIIYSINSARNPDNFLYALEESDKELRQNHGEYVVITKYDEKFRSELIEKIKEKYGGKDD